MNSNNENSTKIVAVVAFLLAPSNSSISIAVIIKMTNFTIASTELFCRLITFLVVVLLSIAESLSSSWWDSSEDITSGAEVVSK